MSAYVNKDTVAALEAACDGMFLLMDTARHNGFKRTQVEIRQHIRECETC